MVSDILTRDGLRIQNNMDDWDHETSQSYRYKWTQQGNPSLKDWTY